MKVQVNGATLHVTDEGVGEPSLLFLHYFGGSSREWRGVIEILAPSHRCIALDMRGFGDSEATPGGYSVAENADDVVALIASLRLQKFVLVGHSMGGKIALSLAAQRPAGLQKLILVAPSPPTPEPIPDAERMRLLTTHGTRAAAQATLDKITAQPLPKPLNEQTLDDNLKSSPAAWRAWLQSGSREDIAALMPCIEVPTTVIAGAQDGGMTPDLLQREVVNRLADARLAIVPNAAHLLPLEAPQKLAQLIAAGGASHPARKHDQVAERRRRNLKQSGSALVVSL